MHLSGNKTYLSLLVAGAYWISVNRGWFPRIPEIDAALVLMVVGFLRQGSKKDAAKAVKEIKAEVPAAVVKAQEEAPPA